VYRTPTNPQCKLELWISQRVSVHAIVTYKNGDQVKLGHVLQFDGRIEEGPFEDDLTEALAGEAIGTRPVRVFESKVVKAKREES
jgi:hypothetical protein